MYKEIGFMQIDDGERRLFDQYFKQYSVHEDSKADNLCDCETASRRKPEFFCDVRVNELSDEQQTGGRGSQRRV